MNVFEICNIELCELVAVFYVLLKIIADGLIFIQSQGGFNNCIDETC